MLKANIDDEHEKHQAKLYQQQDSIETLKAALEERQKATESLQNIYDKTHQVLSGLLREVQVLAMSSDCDSLPLLKLLGKSLDINTSNARLYIKSLEKKIFEMTELIKYDEYMQYAESKERTPPVSRRRRRAPPA